MTNRKKEKARGKAKVENLKQIKQISLIQPFMMDMGRKVKKPLKQSMNIYKPISNIEVKR